MPKEKLDKKRIEKHATVKYIKWKDSASCTVNIVESRNQIKLSLIENYVLFLIRCISFILLVARMDLL